MKLSSLLTFFIFLTLGCKAEPTSKSNNEITVLNNTSLEEDKNAENINVRIDTQEKLIDNSSVTTITEDYKPPKSSKPKNETIVTESMKSDEENKSKVEPNIINQSTQNIEVAETQDTQDFPKEEPVVDIPEERIPLPFNLSHEKWNTLLQKYVTTDGKVDYAGFKKDRTVLETYLSLLSENEPKPEWSKAETMAFWINAYNAHTIDLIVKNYPLSSITDLDGGDPWKVKRISIGGKMYSLNNIEHDILRPTYKDARIHFAVNCAAKSCPKIYNQAWTESNLEANLEKLTKEFVNNTLENQITANKVNLSKIFEWYKSDFGELISFLNRYSTVKISPKAQLAFNEYDWKLNNK